MTLKQVRTDIADIIAAGLNVRCESSWTGTLGPHEAQLRWGGDGLWLDADEEIGTWCGPGVVLSVMLTANAQDLVGAQEWLETKVELLWRLGTTGAALPNAGGRFPRCRNAAEPVELLDMEGRPSGLLGVLVTFHPTQHDLEPTAQI